MIRAPLLFLVIASSLAFAQEATLAGRFRHFDINGDGALVDALRKQLMLDALLRQEAEPSAEAFVEAVSARLEPSASDDAFVARIEHVMPQSRKPQKKRWRAPLAWAAGFVLAGLLGAELFVSLTPASAATIVQRALEAHSALLDRCYRVEVRGERDGDGPPRQESLLWTRGDAFWTQIRGAEQTAAWGREASGSVWFALSPKIGARLAAAEVPEELEIACELRSVRLARQR